MATGRISKWLRGAAISAALASGVAGAVAVSVLRYGPVPTDRAEKLSTVVLDRNDALLRAYTTEDGHWRLPIEIKDVDPAYLRMLMAFEDRRFRSHIGVDPVAVARAGAQFVRHRRLVSGSSTLTMQVSRLLDGRHEKTARGKIRQMIRALALERQFSKDQILSLYLRLAPYGGNLEGVRAASLAYFGKEPKRLSPGEAALLVAIPQSPEARRPDIYPERARRARDRVIAQAVRHGALSAADAQAAMAEKIPTVRRPFAKHAAHLADVAIEAEPARQVHRLTIDGTMQRSLEAAARDHATQAGGGLSAAVVAVETATGEVVGYVGSAGYLDMGRAGAVDMARAVRSPGSTLKPVIYALGFDAGLIHPNTLIDDRPQRFGTYRPKNFDNDWHGVVTVREALAQSLNIPAVAVLEAVGPGRLVGRLERAGLKPVLPDNAEPNLAVALGGIGLRLTDLAQLYAALARGGGAQPIFWRSDDRGREKDSGETQLVSRVAAWYVGDILKHAPAPVHAKTGQIAYKTGTSYGYRDAWSVGYDGRHTIAVWVGRADGQPVAGLTGRTAAAPLLFDAFKRVSEKRTPLGAAPFGVLHASGDALPAPLRRFQPDAAMTGVAAPKGGFRERPLAIAFPADRSVLDADSALEDGIAVKAEGGVLPLRWMVDGVPAGDISHTRELTVRATGRGFVNVTVIDAAGHAERISIRLK